MSYIHLPLSISTFSQVALEARNKVAVYPQMEYHSLPFNLGMAWPIVQVVTFWVGSTTKLKILGIGASSGCGG